LVDSFIPIEYFRDEKRRPQLSDYPGTTIDAKSKKSVKHENQDLGHPDDSEEHDDNDQ
jgi:hypothetical protein